MTKINQANTCHPNGAAAYKSANLSYYPIRSSTEIDRHLPPLHHHQPLGFVLRSEEAKMLGIARQRIVCGGVSASTLQRIRTQFLLYASRNYSSTAKEVTISSQQYSNLEEMKKVCMRGFKNVVGKFEELRRSFKKISNSLEDDERLRFFNSLNLRI
ncbi:hypothetical protein CsSME_00007184 [Camellia sinensis var. sinensis]